MRKTFSTLILIIGLALSANSQDTLKANILRVCEYDTAAKNNLKNCQYFKEKSEFVFSDSSVVATYADSSGGNVEKYKLNKTQSNTGLVQYFCSIGNTNVIIYYYKPIGLVKMYYYNRKERKTYVYSYFKVE